MSTLHKSEKGTQHLEPREGQRGLLCSNKVPIRCPSLGFNYDSTTEDDALDYLAEILVTSYLDNKRYGNKNGNKTGGHILPCIDKGTG